MKQQRHTGTVRRRVRLAIGMIMLATITGGVYLLSQPSHQAR